MDSGATFALAFSVVLLGANARAQEAPRNTITIDADRDARVQSVSVLGAGTIPRTEVSLQTCTSLPCTVPRDARADWILIEGRDGEAGHSLPLDPGDIRVQLHPTRLIAIERTLRPSLIVSAAATATWALSMSLSAWATGCQAFGFDFGSRCAFTGVTSVGSIASFAVTSVFAAGYEAAAITANDHRATVTLQPSAHAVLAGVLVRF